MKKFTSLFLALVMLLSLSACRSNNAQSTDSDLPPTITSADNAGELTNSAPEKEQGPTEGLTTTNEDNKETASLPIPDDDNPAIDQPVPDEDSHAPTEKPVTTSAGSPETTTTESSQTPAGDTVDDPVGDTVDDPVGEPSGCEHTYTTATCTMPKICTKCQHIAGHSLPHNYANGVCTVCGRSEMAFNIKEGDWVASIVKPGTSDQGDVLCLYILTKIDYANAVCYSNASACILNIGKVIHNGKTYYVDYYPLAFYSVDWEENDDTTTVTSRSSESAPKIVLTKTSETQLTVDSCNGSANIPVGTVFTKQ